MDFEDKKVIVTGGGKGIGKKLVEKIVTENAIVGVFDIDEKALNELKKDNPGVFCKVCDVSDIDQVEKAVDEFFNKYQAIDVLINNAGMPRNAPLISLAGGIKKHDVKLWDEVIAANLSSVFYMTLHVVEKMIKKRTKGVIINVSSISANGNAGQTAYSAAKAGVNALTMTWAKELNPWGIRVAGIAPGFTKTNTTLKIMSEKVIDDWNKEIPLRRMAEPSEIAEGILFIIKNDYFNGKVLELDGGLII